LTILQKSRKIELYKGGSDMSDLGNKEIFSKNLKYYMELNNKTRIDVCRDLDFPYTTFAEWYNGNIYPRIDKIELLARYFGIEKSDLIENKENQIDNTDADFMALYEGYQTLNETDKSILKATLDAIVNAKKGDK
jgi:transcriptional regulator with XRE-family HTH domain